MYKTERKQLIEHKFIHVIIFAHLLVFSHILIPVDKGIKILSFLNVKVN